MEIIPEIPENNIMCNLQYHSGPKWSAANCASLIICCYYYNIPGVKTVSYQLTFCQHFPSKFDPKTSLQSLIFPTSGPVQQSYKEAVKGTVRMAAAVGSNSSTCRPVPGWQVIIPLHAVERGHLSLRCRDDIYTCASLDIKNMIYIYILTFFGIHSCLFINFFIYLFI